jgi:hypothetical protein
MTPTTEQQAHETSAMQEPKATKQKAQRRVAVSPPKPRVAPEKAKTRKKATVAKKAPKRAAAEARQGTKTAQALNLLRRPNGATLDELMKALSWQAHSVRGFLSGTLGKKMGLAVASTRREDGERVYSLSR